MRSIVIASSSQKMTAKLNRVLLTVTDDIYYCKSGAQLYSLCDRIGGGVLIVSGFKDISVNDIKNTLSLDWDIVAVLPSGMPAPFYSSNLTVLTAPVSARELLSAVEMLMNVTEYKKTAYEAEKADAVKEAKNILMKRKCISEDKAHYLLQKLSMDKGLSMKKIAEQIIAESGLSKT